MNISAFSKWTASLSIGLFALIHHDADAFWKRRKPARNISATNPIANAVGVLDVYPFEEKNRALRCTAFHLGDGYVATAGHCFLGSRDCNGAKVRWANSGKVSYCNKVHYSFASESFAGAAAFSTDLAVFSVSDAPAEKLDLVNTPEFSDTLSTSTVYFVQAKLRNGKVTAEVGQPCQLTTGRITNIFGQPKTADTASHNCAVDEFSAGTPLINPTTNTLMALHQTSSTIPVYEDSGNSSAGLKMVNYAKLMSDLDLIRITHSDSIPMRNIRIGGFSGEVFATGFYEKISMNVAKIHATRDFDTVSFTAHNGIDSQLEITGADGRKMIFVGPRRAGHEQRFQFKAPVSIVLKSAHTGMAPAAWIEDIQSP